MKGPGKAQLKLVLVGLAVACILSQPHSVIAQRSGTTPYPPPAKANQTYNTRDTAPMGTDGRPAGTGNGTLENWRRESPADQGTILRRRRLLAELTEDFAQLSRINKEGIPALSSSSTLDYEKVSQVTGEINSRAKRIKSNSSLALKEKKGERRTYEADAAQLGSMLPELSRLIESFLDNPVFSTASVHDDDLRSTAGRDLESIIRLSDTINRLAKRLAKTATTESAKGQRG